MHKANFIFQNLAFKQITNLSNKRKINHIDYILKYNDGYVFFGFDFIRLNSRNAFDTGMQMIAYTLMVIKICFFTTTSYFENLI